MLKYISKRLLFIIPVIIGISFILFSILSLSPGDPARTILGTDANEEAVLQKQIELGLDKPFIVRYLNYMSGLIQGDLGTSYKSGEPVINEIALRFPYTIRLAVFSVLIALIVALPIGIISAVKQYSALDTISIVAALIGASFPNFWLGLLLILFFSLKLNILPTYGVEVWQGYILPSITLGLGPMAMLTRMTRSSMLEVIRMDYVRMARSKGASELSIILKHALRNALLPVITITGTILGVLMGGAVLIEMVFSINGMGSMIVSGIREKDIPIVMGGVLIISVIYSLLNLIVDLLYGLIDPRIKVGQKE